MFTAKMSRLFIAPPAALQLRKQNWMMLKNHHFLMILIFKDDRWAMILLLAPRALNCLPSCVAVFYHPDDTRYQHLHGKQAIVPLFDHAVPFLQMNKLIGKGTGLGNVLHIW